MIEKETAKAVIFGAGSMPSGKKIKSMITGSDFIICADGGFDNAKEIGILPDVLIGDLDSIKEIKIGRSIIDNSNIKLIKYPREKDSSDLELSIEYAVEQGFKDIIVFAAMGSRIDHSLSNIHLLVRYSLDGYKVKIIDDNNIISLIYPNMEIEKDDYKYSLIPIGLDGIVVSLKGFKYELENKLIPFGTTLGVSNIVIENKAEIKLHSGTGVLIQSID